MTGLTASLSSTSLMNLTYGYGAQNNGRIRSRTDAVQPEHSTAYTYDAVNRLTAVNAANGSWGIGWGLDVYGNRTSQTPSGLAAGKVGSPTSGYTNNRNNAFVYDFAGNVTNDGAGHTYAYDGENRIRQVDGGTIQYDYDDQGRRVKKIVGSTTTFYVYGSTGLLSEFTSAPGTTTAASTDRLQYRVGEQTGTAVLLMSPTGAVLENNRVLPYGELWSTFTSSSNDQKFTTYDRESVTGLDYAMATYYGNLYGRFMSPDPVLGDPANPQSWNRYIYGLNDPINFIDPSGLEIQDAGNGCTWDTSTNTLRCPNPGGGGPVIGPLPGGCLDVYIDGVYVGNTCGGGGRTEVTQTAGNEGPVMKAGPVTPPPITMGDRIRGAVCGLFSPLLGAAAKARGTVGVGVGGNAGVGFIAGVAASAGIQIVADKERNLGIAINVGGNPGYGVLGVGALAGVQGSVSTGSNIYALTSWSVGLGGTAGPVGLDATASNTATTLTGTFGVGAGTKGAGLSLNSRRCQQTSVGIFVIIVSYIRRGVGIVDRFQPPDRIVGVAGLESLAAGVGPVLDQSRIWIKVISERWRRDYNVHSSRSVPRYYLERHSLRQHVLRNW